VSTRHQLVVRGVVQGVGFRPHAAHLAGQLGLVGGCRNDATCVVIDVEGPSARLGEFERRLVAEAPPLAQVEDLEITELEPAGARGFEIRESSRSVGVRTTVPPDTAPCADCLRELADPADRRYRHPFVTCTQCGPRLTITLDLPYDRPATTMAPFPLCAACDREYADPADRRFHAQPVCCHDCGPCLTLRTPVGDPVATGTEPVLAAAVAALAAGRVLAVKGLGGYHLVCDAASRTAVAALRERKSRPAQPFAVMVADLATASRLVDVGGAAALLTDPARPIVLLPVRDDAPVDPGVAPHLDELGVLLPYTPLHHLLLGDLAAARGGPVALVVTSGNVSGEPLCFDDADALNRLGGIADLFLGHDRAIATPVEDSVVGWSEETGAVPLRRSRGYAPLPLDVAGATAQDVLAAGAEVKNTVALTRAGRAHLSAHVGDLAGLAGRAAHLAAADQLLRFHRATPSVVVADRHPGYASRAWAARYAASLGVPLLEVQHHHAHLAALAAEHGLLDEPLLGLVFDGTGYGCDATVWGGELLLLTDGGTRAERLDHLGTVRLPGGDEGVRNPVRTAALALLDAGVAWEGTPVDDELTPVERSFLTRAHETGLGVVPTSSAGRLIDAVASVLDVRHRVTYEAQAAIELEAVARRWRRRHPDVAPVGLPFDDLEPAPLLATLVELLPVHDQGLLAWSFHVALARGAADAAARTAPPGGPTVGLSGGVFVNRLLLELTADRLREHGLRPLTHRRVPANDGGLALGQAAVGARSVLTSAGTVS